MEFMHWEYMYLAKILSFPLENFQAMPLQVQVFLDTNNHQNYTSFKHNNEWMKQRSHNCPLSIVIKDSNLCSRVFKEGFLMTRSAFLQVRFSAQNLICGIQKKLFCQAVYLLRITWDVRAHPSSCVSANFIVLTGNTSTADIFGHNWTSENLSDTILCSFWA